MKDNSNKIILDLCGGTGSWSKPYKDAGYDVRVITVPMFDVTDPYVIEQCISLKPYGILAAPPCTMFSFARTRGKTERDFQEGMKCVKSCLEIIWGCRETPLYKKDDCLSFWALENPFGFLRQFLGIPKHTFEPHHYGDPYTKKTDLWGFFKEPKQQQVPFDKIEKGYIHTIGPTGKPMKKFDALLDKEINYRESTRHLSRAARRSITPPGFARAFFKANQ